MRRRDLGDVVGKENFHNTPHVKNMRELDDWDDDTDFDDGIEFAKCENNVLQKILNKAYILTGRFYRVVSNNPKRHINASKFLNPNYDSVLDNISLEYQDFTNPDQIDTSTYISVDEEYYDKD